MESARHDYEQAPQTEVKLSSLQKVFHGIVFKPFLSSLPGWGPVNPPASKSNPNLDPNLSHIRPNPKTTQNLSWNPANCKQSMLTAKRQRQWQWQPVAAREKFKCKALCRPVHPWPSQNNCGIMRKDIQVSEQLVTCRFTLVFFLILEVAPRTVLGTGYHVP